MSDVEARARLADLVAASDEPTLDAADLDDLLRRSKLTDALGRIPTDVNWTETYSLNHAASIGWKLKAGRLTNAYLFMSGGKMLSRNQMFDHCMAMARRYAAASGVASVGFGTSRDRRPLRDEGVAPPGLYIDGLSLYAGPNPDLAVRRGGGRFGRHVETNWSPDDRSEGGWDYKPSRLGTRSTSR